jgi:asparagine synthase (glutamine-hydrolysing)
VRTYLATGFEAFDRSFFRDVVPLPPGTWQSVDLRTAERGSPEPFWFPERVVATVSDVESATATFAERFADAVRVHLRSDVPVGCALSGGLDSSSVAAVAAKLLPGKQLETFSVVFPGHPSDERSFIDVVARHTRANVHVVTPTPSQFLEDLDRFVWTHDEPVGSMSQYAAYALARLTRAAGVPVTLNGQGGDEVFSAYWQCLLSHLADSLRGGRPLGSLGFLLGALLPSGNAALFGELPGMLRRFRDRRAGGTALELRAGPATASGPLGAVLRMTEAERRVFDVRQLILPRLLKWDDRNFMAFSVEGRYPFLDHPLIEACLSFTARSLYDKGWVKEPLRRALAADLPRSVVRRKTKVGFETPQPDWLRGPLRPAIEAWLAADAPVWHFVEPAAARRLAERVFRTAAPRREDHEALFRLWCLERWLRVFSLSPRSAAAA